MLLFLDINLAPDSIKHHTATILHNHYKDIIERRQQSMTEQALGDAQTQRANEKLTERKKEVSV